ncbi:peptide synthetase, partial [Streptomyces sp. AC536]|nr:peptide synthetase [Streptomyces buecherae]
MGESAFQPYPFLLAAAERLAAGLARRGLTPGDPVGLLLDRPRDVIPAFWGCVLGGFVPCPLPPLPDDADRAREHLAHLGELLDGPLLLTTEPVAGAAPRGARVRMVPIGQLHAEAEAETEPGPARAAAAPADGAP